LIFNYSWIRLFFLDNVMSFVVLKGRKQCWPLRFLFQIDDNVIAYLTMNNHKSFNTKRNWLYLESWDYSSLGIERKVFKLYIFHWWWHVYYFQFVYKTLTNSLIRVQQPGGHQVHFVYELFNKVYLWNLNYINYTMSLNFKALVSNLVGNKAQN
jgi:hypothetical protein